MCDKADTIRSQSYKFKEHKYGKTMVIEFMIYVYKLKIVIL